MNAPFDEIASAFRKYESFCVMSHHRPDGDAYGSQLAVALCLRELGKEVVVWNEDGLLPKFAFLPHSELIHAPAEESERRSFDCLVAVDCSTFLRLGRPLRKLGEVKRTLNLDHHHTNERYGNVVHIADAPATGELLYELFAATDLPFTRAMAECLFVAISTDTGSFQYRGTSARTYEIAADLVRRGADVARLSQACYDTQPLRRTQLLREVLNDLQLSASDRVATSAVSLAQAAALGLQPGDTEDIINHLRAIDTVQVAAFFEEMRVVSSGQPAVRTSLRSKSEAYDVSAICAQFGGGGHRLAAGARIGGTLAEVRERVTAAIHAALGAA